MLTVTSCSSLPDRHGLRWRKGRRQGDVVRRDVVRVEFMRLNPCSIGLPPHGKYHIDVNPSQLASRNQSIVGTVVAPLRDIDEVLDFAKRGEQFSISLQLYF